MLSYIYKPVFNVAHVTCPAGLFELLNVAEKYQVKELVGMASRSIAQVGLSRQNVLAVAETARRFRQFEKARRVASSASMCVCVTAQSWAYGACGFSDKVKRMRPEQKMRNVRNFWIRPSKATNPQLSHLIENDENSISYYMKR